MDPFTWIICCHLKFSVSEAEFPYLPSKPPLTFQYILPITNKCANLPLILKTQAVKEGGREGRKEEREGGREEEEKKKEKTSGFHVCYHAFLFSL